MVRADTYNLETRAHPVPRGLRLHVTSPWMLQLFVPATPRSMAFLDLQQLPTAPCVHSDGGPLEQKLLEIRSVLTRLVPDRFIRQELVVDHYALLGRVARLVEPSVEQVHAKEVIADTTVGGKELDIELA